MTEEPWALDFVAIEVTRRRRTWLFVPSSLCIIVCLSDDKFPVPEDGEDDSVDDEEDEDEEDEDDEL